MEDAVFEDHPITGKRQFAYFHKEYDHYQGVARIAFGDMLHDEERNQKYHLALCDAIDTVHAHGARAIVLDIGTGSGLLAMMAAKHGAEVVYACEAFQPVAKCAEDVMEDNGLRKRIHLIPKASTELEVGPGKDMKEKANIIVAEVFDTELIGEGAIETFADALCRLAQPDCITVPHAATVYAQVVESSFLRSYHIPNPIQVTPELIVEVPASVRTCPGIAAVHDIQLSQLQPDDFVCVTDQMPVFRFVFSEIETLTFNETAVVHLKIKVGGTCHLVVMWWVLEMNPSDSIHLSCAPYWAHPSGKAQPWRDHWLQAVYYPPYEVTVSANEEITLVARRQGYNMCVLISLSRSAKTPEVPFCRCSLHANVSRTRIGALGDRSRHAKYAAVLQKVINEDSVCLCVGSDIMLPMMASMLGAKEVYVVVQDTYVYSLLEEYTKQNEVCNIVAIKKDALCLSEQDEKKKAFVLLGEPHFSTSILPWHNLKFWYQKCSLQHLMGPPDSIVTIPQGFCLKGVAVHFRDLWKIRAPIQATQGFNLRSFDRLVQDAQFVADDRVEPQPLWEYPCMAMTQEFTIVKLDITKDPESTGMISCTGEVLFERQGDCNGVALWAEFMLDDSNTVTSGPTKAIVPGEQIIWDRFARQGVQFLNGTKLDPKALKWEFTFDFSSGLTTFGFDVQ
ncbi:protein arginine N-methyltransferase 7-like isoform X1 [Dermacentor albipictus]|uniref:protein arginine N-methyltransferase 7-like isoform X1 n=2 Tax=Dermacentor albipictus TaxID=60249 RepID=UPI0031FD6BC6